MTKGICARCGAEDSMFWYPYAFGVAPIPSVVDRGIDRSQYFMLCDKCQMDFVNFMHNRGPVIFNMKDMDPEELKKLMDEMVPGPLIVPEYKD